MRKHIAMLGAMAAMSAMFAAHASPSGLTVNKEINYNVGQQTARKKKAMLSASGSNPYRHHKTPKINQRQKRKYLRQNPNMR